MDVDDDGIMVRQSAIEAARSEARFVLRVIPGDEITFKEPTEDVWPAFS